MTVANVSQVAAEVVRSANGTGLNVQASQVVAEVVRVNTATQIQASQVVVEALRIYNGTKILASQIAVEVLRPNVNVSASTRRPVVTLLGAL